MKFKNYLKEEILSISNGNEELGTKKLKFTKRNIEKIAYEWDCEIKEIDFSIKHAILKDNLNRLLFVDIKIMGRRRK